LFQVCGAIAARFEDVWKLEATAVPRGKGGSAVKATWVLLDYGNDFVHVLSARDS